MYTGRFALYNEDAEVEMSPMTITGGGTGLNATDTNSESLVSTTSPYFQDFDAHFSMRTIRKLKSTFAKDWEYGYVWWRFNEADSIFFHHYYIILKSTSIEFGRIDNAENDATDKRLLFNGGTFSLVLGQWYDIRIRAQKYHFNLWINGVEIFDLTDDGHLMDSKGTIPKPSDTMKKGLMGFGADDSEAEFSPLIINSIPSSISRKGYYKGGFQDFRMYRRVLTQTEATNINTNKISVSSIALGKVATIGASVFNE
jgi:hypothetical protein